MFFSDYRLMAREVILGLTVAHSWTRGTLELHLRLGANSW